MALEKQVILKVILMKEYLSQFADFRADEDSNGKDELKHDDFGY